MLKLVLNCGSLMAGCAFLLPAQAYDVAAARNAAAGNASCNQVAQGKANGFYWEIGDVDGVIASGAQGNNPPAANQVLYVDSASKWIFGAYVLQKRGGLAYLQPGDGGGYANSDVAYLQMGNGYDNLNNLTCTVADTIGRCYGKGSNNVQKTSDIGRFNYSSGEFLAMANNNLGLQDLNAAQLAHELQLYIPGVDFSFAAPNPAAGVEIDSNNYVLFLRSILSGALVMHDALTADSWCTNPNTYGGLLGTKYKYCPTQSSTPPFPNNISFAYGLAHWIETDPVSASDGGVPGDGSFSAPGASGFYPWIDSTRTYYGIVAPARAEALIPANELDYQKAVLCGQAIRQAFVGS